MTRGRVLLAVVLHATAWLGFEAGRHDFELFPSVTRTESGERALRLRWSTTSPDGGCRTGGRLDCVPGRWRPQLRYAADEPDPSE
jgi:hypothetical protein